MVLSAPLPYSYYIWFTPPSLRILAIYCTPFSFKPSLLGCAGSNRFLALLVGQKKKKKEAPTPKKRIEGDQLLLFNVILNVQVLFVNSELCFMYEFFFFFQQVWKYLKGLSGSQWMVCLYCQMLKEDVIHNCLAYNIVKMFNGEYNSNIFFFRSSALAYTANFNGGCNSNLVSLPGLYC